MDILQRRILKLAKNNQTSIGFIEILVFYMEQRIVPNHTILLDYSSLQNMCQQLDNRLADVTGWSINVETQDKNQRVTESKSNNIQSLCENRPAITYNRRWLMERFINSLTLAQQSSELEQMNLEEEEPSFPAKINIQPNPQIKIRHQRIMDSIVNRNKQSQFTVELNNGIKDLAVFNQYKLLFIKVYLQKPDLKKNEQKILNKKVKNIIFTVKPGNQYKKQDLKSAVEMLRRSMNQECIDKDSTEILIKEESKIIKWQ